MVKIWEMNDEGKETTEVKRSPFLAYREATLRLRERLEELGGLSDSESSSSDLQNDPSPFFSSGNCSVVQTIVPFAPSLPVRIIMASEVNVDTTVAFEALSFFSHYRTVEDVMAFRAGCKVSSTGNEGDVIIEPCREGEPVCLTRPKGVKEECTYMYSCVFKDCHITMPFTSFEARLLRTLNIAPTQLHPNSWGFVKAFELVCWALDVPPRMCVFFSFYQTKGVDRGKWVSFNSHAKTGPLFVPLTQSNKTFKNRFFRVRGAPSYPELFIDKHGAQKFPLYWSSVINQVLGVREDELPPGHVQTVNLLASLASLHCSDVIGLEGNKEGLLQLLGKISPYFLYIVEYYFE